VTADQEVITYCQVGMRASHDLFVLALIGHDLARLHNYYGSWEEWGNRDDTPIRVKQ
jgi:thiosulfate/3-mercaptopyruvate sulfurtransferase